MTVATRTRCAVHKYAAAVISGEIVAGKPVRDACARHVRDLEHGQERGLYFDDEEADRAISFFAFLRHSKGEWAGTAFALSPWQAFIVGAVFGWKRADGTRRYRTVYIEVARKNGKTTLLSGLGLLLAFFDNEPGAEVYAAATKRDQAKICWSEARRMVLATPALRRRITALVSNLHTEATNSKFEPLGADGDSMDGLNIHAAIVDELHAHKTRAIVDVLETATGARRQPLILYITTAGSNQTSVCHERHAYGRQVAAGVVEDDALFAYIATIDEGDDWRDESVWIKANPNLGVSAKIEKLREAARRAAALPTELNAFLRLHLDVWTHQVDRWIPLELWDEQAGPPIDEDEMGSRRCFGGLDIGATSDLNAWLLLFPDPDDEETVDVLARFWCPEDWAYSKDNQYAEQYQAWARDGYLTLTPGKAADRKAIRAQIVADARKFNFVDGNLDRLFDGFEMQLELQEEGLEFFPMGQGFYSMAGPMKEFERRLLLRKLRHGGNPVLRFCAESMSVAQDAAGNLKPDKSNRQSKIDGIVALVMALDRAMRNADGGESVYATRGVLVLGE